MLLEAGYRLHCRGAVQVKGKGALVTYLVPTPYDPTFPAPTPVMAGPAALLQAPEPAALEGQDLVASAATAAGQGGAGVLCSPGNDTGDACVTEVPDAVDVGKDRDMDTSLVTIAGHDTVNEANDIPQTIVESGNNAAGSVPVTTPAVTSTPVQQRRRGSEPVSRPVPQTLPLSQAGRTLPLPLTASLAANGAVLSRLVPEPTARRQHRPPS